jgi:hypothetical protein
VVAGRGGGDEVGDGREGVGRLGVDGGDGEWEFQGVGRGRGRGRSRGRARGVWFGCIEVGVEGGEVEYQEDETVFPAVVGEG